MSHKVVERSIKLMAILIVLVISIGGLVEIIPLMLQAQVTDPMPGLKPYEPLTLAGKDIYVREGCYVCHSQQVRPFRSETERYGPYSIPGESVYDRPFQFGSKRTGPDLARVGGRYADEWHRVHLISPRDVVPESNMPGYPWLEDRTVDGSDIAKRMSVLKKLGDPYTQDQIDTAAEAVNGATEMDALIAYLQNLGLARKQLEMN